MSTKTELEEFIDNLNITDGEYGNYATLLELVQNADAALFTKIVEEVKNGNISFNDFTKWIGVDYSYDIETVLNAQEKLYMEYQMLREYTLEKNTALQNYGIVLDDSTKQLITTYKNNNNSAVNVEKSNIIMSLLSKHSNNVLEDVYKSRMINLILSNTDDSTLDSFLMSIHDFIVPVDYNHVVLNTYDKSFMKENNMTEDEMKKMKSFAAFLSTYYQ